MWSALDERIARFDTTTPRAFYSLRELVFVGVAIVIFYGLPILFLAGYPPTIDRIGQLQSFFVHGVLTRDVIIPNITGLFLDALIVYIALLIAYPKRTIVKDRTSRLLTLLITICKTKRLPTLNQKDAVNVRLYIVKLFFVPLMLVFFIDTAQTLNFEIVTFWNQLSWSLDSYVNLLFLGVALAFFVDVSFFVFGYMTESTTLNNLVVSVDPTVSGWVVCLLCYPPFSLLTVEIFSSLHEAGSFFEPVWLWLVVFTLGVVLLGIYALASVNLYGRASNLTYRGLVTWGAYSIVRHPAYTAKVSSWLLASLPFLFISPWLVLTMIGWATLYILRALTEERHIKMVARAEYEAYKKEVPYRFIPYIV